MNNERPDSAPVRPRRPGQGPPREGQTRGRGEGGKGRAGAHRHLLLRVEPMVPQGLQGLVSLQGQGPQHHLLVPQPLLRLLQLGSDLGKGGLVTSGWGWGSGEQCQLRPGPRRRGSHREAPRGHVVTGRPCSPGQRRDPGHRQPPGPPPAANQLRVDVGETAKKTRARLEGRAGTHLSRLSLSRHTAP